MEAGWGNGEGKMTSSSLPSVSSSTRTASLDQELLNSVAALYVLPNPANPPDFGDSSTVPGGNSSDVHLQNGYFSADVLYSWPKKSKSELVRLLVESHGMFSTLFKLMNDVTSSHAITSHVAFEKFEADISYAADTEGEGLLLIAHESPSNPSYPSASILSQLTNALVTTITFRWQTLSRAFQNAKENDVGNLLQSTLSPLIRPRCDHVLLVEQPQCFPGVPDSIAQRIEEVLYDFEGSVTCDSTGDALKEDCVEYHCLGSILFYKEYLIASHLSPKVQRQFYLGMKTELNKLNDRVLWNQSKSSVLWKPIFLNNEDASSGDPSPFVQCHHAALVGMDFFTLGFLLRPICSTDRCAVDDQWIEEAVHALEQLSSSDLSQQLEHCLAQELTANFDKQSQTSLVSHMDEKSSVQTLSDDVKSNFSEGNRDSDIVTGTTGSDASSAKLSADGSETLSSDRIFSSPSDHIRETVSFNLRNLVYSFVRVANGRGILVSGRDERIHSVVVQNFHHHAKMTQAILHKAKSYRVKLRSHASDSKWISRALTPVCEYGTFFQCYLEVKSQRTKRAKLKRKNYWVIGRLYEPLSSEIYVCLHDSIAQESVMELAFKIGSIASI